MIQRPHRPVASALLHPASLLASLLAIAVLLVNDHWLKSAWGHPLTGKLSDVAGLLFFPLLVVALVEITQAAFRRYRGPSNRILLLAAITTALGFSLLQIAPPATYLYELALGALQHPATTLHTLLAGKNLAAIPHVTATPDPTDLLALPVLAATYAIGRRSNTSPPRTPEPPPPTPANSREARPRAEGSRDSRTTPLDPT